VASHEDTGYDWLNKIRHGRCQVIVQGRASATCRYKVYWVDRKKGSYQVEIEP
jgi:hypothetical protein